MISWWRICRWLAVNFKIHVCSSGVNSDLGECFFWGPCKPVIASSDLWFQEMFTFLKMHANAMKWSLAFMGLSEGSFRACAFCHGRLAGLHARVRLVNIPLRLNKKHERMMLSLPAGTPGVIRLLVKCCCVCNCKLAVLPGARLHKLALHYSTVAEPSHPRTCFSGLSVAHAHWVQARAQQGRTRSPRALIGSRGQWRGSCHGHKRKTTQSPLSSCSCTLPKHQSIWSAPIHVNRRRSESMTGINK